MKSKELGLTCGPEGGPEGAAPRSSEWEQRTSTGSENGKAVATQMNEDVGSFQQLVAARRSASGSGRRRAR